LVFEMESELDWYEEFVYPASSVSMEANDLKMNESHNELIGSQLTDNFSSNYPKKKDFAKNYKLNKYDFVLPGMGETPTYCNRAKVAGLSTDQTARILNVIHCGTMSCPHCWGLWQAQEVFKASVLEEAYSRSRNQRPCNFTISYRPTTTITLAEIRKNRTKLTNYVKKQGIVAGVTLPHYHRIAPDVKPVLKNVTKTLSSKSHWWYLRDSYNQGHISEINKILGANYITINDFLELAIHYHGHGFPGDILLTGDKNKGILLKKMKLYTGTNGKDVYEFETINNIIDNHFYEISHTSQLDINKQLQKDRNGKYKRHYLTTFSTFGSLHNAKPEDFLPSEQVLEIRQQALAYMNTKRKRKLVLNGDTVAWDVPESSSDVIVEDFRLFLPMSRFRVTSVESSTHVTAFIDSARLQKPENADYIKYTIDTYNALLDAPGIPSKYKHLWAYGFSKAELPDFITNDDSDFHKYKSINPVAYDLIVSVFKDGLRSPPSTFETIYRKRVTFVKFTDIKVDWASVSLSVSSGSSLFPGLDDIDIDSLCSKLKERVKKPDLMEGWL